MPEELNDTEAELRALGAQADASQGEEEQEIAQPAVEETPKPSEETDGQPVPEEKTESPGTEAANPVAEKELSPFEKAKAEKKDREARAWQKIEEEKASLKAEREKLESSRREIEAERPKGGPLRDKHGFSAEDYEAAAKENEAAGDDNFAKLARAKAQDLRGQEQQHFQKAALAEFDLGVKDVTKTRPELAYEPNSEVTKELISILREFPALSQGRKGFATAVQIYDSRKTAASVPELQKKIDELTKEKERLTKLTSLPSSGPRPAGKAKETDMSESDLRKMAEAHDAA